MGNAFWLGIIGGIAGILAVILVVQLGGMPEAFNAMGGLQPYSNAAGAALIFSLVGVAGGVLENRKIIGATLMIIGALGALISIGLLSTLSFVEFVAGAILIPLGVLISLFGVLTFVLFLLGGILILTQAPHPH
ncbi:MAG: hypothetical protein WCE82_00100 [Halobacteriota archaeon]